MGPLAEPIGDQLEPQSEMRHQNTRVDAVSPEFEEPRTATVNESVNAVDRFVNPFGLDFRIKFADAHSNPGDSPKPGDIDTVPVHPEDRPRDPNDDSKEHSNDDSGNDT